MTINRVAITGSTGFVGSHLCRRLVRDRLEVHTIVRPESDLSQIKDVAKDLSVHVHDGSMNGMLEILKKSRPEIVFHLASLFLAQHKSEDVDALIKSNILFGSQLIEAMAVTHVPYLVNTGTSWQHYKNKEFDPVCLYAATKQAFEDLLRFYTETSLLKVITLKLFDTYGPFDSRPKLFSFLLNCANKKAPVLMSPGEQRLDLVYIDDVVDAYCIAGDRLAAGKVVTGESYAVSSSKSVRLKEIVQLFDRLTGKKLHINWGGRPYRPREVMVPWNNGQTLPHWYPKISLQEGIQKMLKALENT